MSTSLWSPLGEMSKPTRPLPRMARTGTERRRPSKLTAQVLDERDRQVDDDVDHRDRDGGEPDLAAPVQGSEYRRLAQAKMPVDVLQDDDAVVHEDADREGQRQHRDEVQVQPEQVHE